METKIYKVENVNGHIYRIIGPTNEFAYLVIGGERSLLIDTCCGVGLLRDVVDSITHLPYDVVLTHGHVDHAGGVGLFKDKTIYLNEKDFKTARIMTKKFFLKTYLKESTKLYKAQIDFKTIKYVKNNKIKYTNLEDNHIFDLGGITIKAIALPGHTKGMMSLLFVEDRILLTGDACNPSTFLFLPGSLTVTKYHGILQSYIPKVEGQFDSILLSHLPKICSNKILDDMLLLTEDIIAGKKCEQTMKIMFIKVKIARKLDDKTGFAKDYQADLFYNKIV